MAATSVMIALPLPGIHRPFTKDDMNEAAITYNSLPRIQPQMHVDMGHVKDLVAIIARHGQLGRFSFHLVHRHDALPDNTVRLESDLGVVPGKWNKATSIDSINLGDIHGVVFKFLPDEHRLVPFEFGEGPSPVALGDMDNDFVRDFTSYLTRNNLTNVFALEIVDPAVGGQPGMCTAEVEVDKLGTVVLPKSMVNAEAFLPTGWPGPQPEDGDSPPAGQTWAEKTDKSHKVFINKPVCTAEELVDELAHQGIINL